MTTTSPPLSPQEVWAKDVATLPDTAADWLLPGFLSRGNITLLTSMWKAGKTTLLTHLLARRLTGQPLLGRPVVPGKTVVISEEPRSLWADRCRQFDFGDSLCLFTQPFPHLPTADEWRRLLDRVAHLRTEHNIDLLVIDSLTHFLRAESCSRGILDLILPIRELTSQGVAALLMHHPRRQNATAGDAARGHGALQAEVDISIEMRHTGKDLDSRARRFYCLSRRPTTPRNLHFELNADSTDYTVLADAPDFHFTTRWEVLHSILDDAPQRLTSQDILEEWPDTHPKPSPTTLYTTLQSALTNNLLKCEGTGKKSDPLRYWLETTEARWNENPIHVYLEHQAKEHNQPFRPLHEHRRRPRMDV